MKMRRWFVVDIWWLYLRIDNTGPLNPVFEIEYWSQNKLDQSPKFVSLVSKTEELPDKTFTIEK